MAAAVKEKPIIFSSESVRQILSSAKTQTRRVMKHQPEHDGEDGTYWESSWDAGLLGKSTIVDSCPYGAVGDLLYVRETWAVTDQGEGVLGFGEFCLEVTYKPDTISDERIIISVPESEYLKYANENFESKWRSPRFMPRWASRLTLTITDVRVERLQDISEEDAVAEGCSATKLSRFISADEHESAREQFARLWDDLNARRGYPWADSPWVWIVAFQVVS